MRPSASAPPASPRPMRSCSLASTALPVTRSSSSVASSFATSTSLGPLPARTPPSPCCPARLEVACPVPAAPLSPRQPPAAAAPRGRAATAGGRTPPSPCCPPRVEEPSCAPLTAPASPRRLVASPSTIAGVPSRRSAAAVRHGSAGRRASMTSVASDVLCATVSKAMRTATPPRGLKVGAAAAALSGRENSPPVNAVTLETSTAAKPAGHTPGGDAGPPIVRTVVRPMLAASYVVCGAGGEGRQVFAAPPRQARTPLVPLRVGGDRSPRRASVASCAVEAGPCAAAPADAPCPQGPAASAGPAKRVPPPVTSPLGAPFRELRSSAVPELTVTPSRRGGEGTAPPQLQLSISRRRASAPVQAVVAQEAPPAAWAREAEATELLRCQSAINFVVGGA